MYLEKLVQPCKKAIVMLLFPREIQGIKSNNCVEFSVFNVFS